MDTGILPIADRPTIAPPQSVDSRAVDIPRSDDYSRISSSSYTTPDVEVNLSQRGRQLSIENFERETVQASQQNQESQLEDRFEERERAQSLQKDFYAQNNSATINPVQINNDQTLDIGTQEEVRLDTSNYDIPQPQRENPYQEVVQSKGFEVRDQTDARNEERAKILEAINTATVVPVNSNQSASVASQYNISPESALGHSVSTFA